MLLQDLSSCIVFIKVFSYILQMKKETGTFGSHLLLAISTTALTLVVLCSNVATATIPLIQSAYAAVGKSQPTLLATSGDNIYATWSSNKTGNWEISFRASNDGGKTLGAKINLSNDTSDSKDPQIAASGSNVYVTWWNTIDNKTGIREPVMKVSTDNGKTFGEKIMLSSNDTAAVSKTA
jgi:hypothetical protein